MEIVPRIDGTATNGNETNGSDAEVSDMEPPCESLCPNVTEQDVVHHLQVHYGLTVSRITQLNGYYDTNFHVIVEKDHSNPVIDSVAADGYVVKISNILDSEKPETLRVQLVLIQHLTRKGICCQAPVRSVQNLDFTDMKATSKAGEERVHKLAVRTFIPGKELGKVTLTPFILYKVGVFVAQLTRALEDFSHSFFDTFDHIWSLNHFPKVAKGLFAVRDETRRRICEEVLEAFNTEVIPQKAHFRKGHIHGDLNVENILVCETVGQGKSFRVCGLLDFQHSASSYLLYELVICTAYAMMAVSTEVPRPLIPGYVLAGYSSILQLNKAERKVFYNLIASRMVQSLVYGAYNAYLDPANEYVLSTAKCGWETLKQFWETPSKDLEKEWGQIVETYVP